MSAVSNFRGMIPDVWMWGEGRWAWGCGRVCVGGSGWEERGEIPFIIALVNYIFLGYQSTCWYLCGFWVGWCSNIGKNW